MDDIEEQWVREFLEEARLKVIRETKVHDDDECEDGEKQGLKSYTQWTTADDQIFVPAATTRAKLHPGAWEIEQAPSIGIYFEKVTIKLTDLVQFPDSESDKVINEIRLFWESKDQFTKFRMPHKRGIFLWGPPGSGKSSTVQFVMKDVIDRGGIVIKFYRPELFMKGYRILREIEPDTPVVVIMEDIDAILEDWSESSVLNILDGAVDELENIVFLATTNYPEKLGARVINRPSRFDRRFKIGFPCKEARKIYFEHLFREYALEQKDEQIAKWVKDTADMSIAHLRELFVAVIILGNTYEDALDILKQMERDISSTQDGGSIGPGFHH